MPTKSLPTLAEQSSATRSAAARRTLLLTTAAATHSLNRMTEAARLEANRAYIEKLNQQVKGSK
jgi:hypothetical protein